MYNDPMFDADPQAWFDSVAGPSASDVIGPPSDVLDTFVDGTPIAEAQSAVASAVGGGKHTAWFHRGDVQALGLTLLGAAMIHVYMGAE